MKYRFIAISKDYAMSFTTTIKQFQTQQHSFSDVKSVKSGQENQNIDYIINAQS